MTATGRLPTTLWVLAGRIRQNAADAVRIDTRTLAVFRVFVGLLILADLVLRSRNFTYFYTDEGVMPRSLATAVSSEAFSFYHYTTDTTVIAALFVLQGLIAVQLIVGYKTRIATILSFLFVVSLDHHNPFVTSYADVLFRMLLFWAIFLPLGERWSIDAVHRDRLPRGSIATVASAFILGQMVYMYFLNGYHKMGEELWETGEATPLIMGLDDMTFLLAPYMREFPALLEIGGLLWYYMLLASPLLLLFVGRRRFIFACTFAIAHLSFAITVRIGAFAYVALAGVLLFVQSQIWEDGKAVCRYATLDYTWLTDRGDELARVASALPNIRFDSDRQRQAKRAVYSGAVGILVISLVLFTLLSHLPVAGLADEETVVEERIEGTASQFSVDQPSWTVFAPTPRTTDGYYVFPAKTANGDVIDVYNDRQMTYDRPDSELQKQYGTYRERFYMNSIRRAGYNEWNDGPAILADHLCEQWEADHGIELTHVNMYRVSEDITEETIVEMDDRDRNAYLVHKHGCGDHEPQYIDRPDL